MAGWAMSDDDLELHEAIARRSYSVGYKDGIGAAIGVMWPQCLAASIATAGLLTSLEGALSRTLDLSSIAREALLIGKDAWASGYAKGVDYGRTGRQVIA